MFHVTWARSFRPGDAVVFTAAKHSAHPGARAKDVRPEPYGEGYRYLVDKFWVVSGRQGAQVILMTRRGKNHVVDQNDPRLHRASWWERLIYRNRFPKPQPPGAPGNLSVQRLP